LQRKRRLHPYKRLLLLRHRQQRDWFAGLLLVVVTVNDLLSNV
jgi:hypothetical protein